jgi:hypothetical protein
VPRILKACCCTHDIKKSKRSGEKRPDGGGRPVFYHASNPWYVIVRYPKASQKQNDNSLLVERNAVVAD